MTHTNDPNAHHGRHLAARELRERAATAAEVAAANLREIVISAAPFDGGTFAQLQNGAQSIAAATLRLAVVKNAVAELEEHLTALTAELTGEPT